MKQVWNRNRYDKIRKCLKDKNLEIQILSSKKKNIFQIAADLNVPVPVVRKILTGKMFEFEGCRK